MDSYTGIVEQGSKRAAALGYPTINIPLEDDVSGIYIARVHVGSEIFPAAAFADSRRKILEAHIIDFSERLYGRKITIELLGKIRDTRDFNDDAKLREAIADDVAKVRRYFKN
ncbi:hypothetical protein A3F27_01705 [Candidatus Kaiserbacteria bacterium RIFCSPHIGHO2_12_FULL_53_13]|uniref:riboflavin kinase n=1 Tax=Candidatus Kaiserbacteria bacterium RIFCSPHIGHO2_12_FULL_53_13 TaxID=1798502 RepID=A0A1F6EAR5_9BACT|nr:MAG: hypothetical protein A3F27_01705 [Candidatus Kaiserbacteria bacterium RIFCSPHIGHO2_12_FULL_53_13]